MRKDRLENILGCAIGALVGMLVAREIYARLMWGEYLWVIGIFFGGATGWCLGEFRELWWSIHRAYHMSRENISRKWDAIVGWKPYRPYWKAVRAMGIGLAAVGLSLVFVLLLSTTKISSLKTDIVSLYPKKIYLIVLGYVFFLEVWGYLLTSNKRNGIWDEKGLQFDAKVGLALAKYGNPISLTILAIIGIPLLIWKYWELIKKLVSFALSEVGKFFARVFALAHSNKRRIRFIGATLGGFIGFFFGSVIIGLLAGAVCGEISRAVAIRRHWIEIIPTEAK